MNLFKIGQSIYVDPTLFDDKRNTIPWSKQILNDDIYYKGLVGHIIDYKNSKYKVLWYIDLKETWVHYSYLTKLPNNIDIIKGIVYINSLKISNSISTNNNNIIERKREIRLSGTKVDICEDYILKMNQLNTLKYQNYN